MRDTTFYIKRGDRLPAIEMALERPSTTDANAWVAADLTGTTIAFQMRPTAGGSLITGSASIVSPATAGIVRYFWGPSDTAAAGEYYAEWQVEFPDGKTETFPNRDHLLVVVVASVD